MTNIIGEHNSKKGYKYLGLITTSGVAILLISGITAGKIVQLSIFPVSAAVLYYPYTYILGDVLAEVYGYAQARKVMWNFIFFSILSVVIYQIVVLLPPATGFTNNEAYTSVLGQVPRIVAGGLLALFTGQVLNDFTLAKMKLLTKGKYLWTRTIGSTAVGQFADAVIFYTISLFGVIPNDLLVKAILASWFLKVLLETLMTPVTYYVIKKLKQVENEDYYDTDTNFNPFIMR